MDNKSRLQKAQTEMLESLAGLETQLCRLYTVFAERFETSRPFWARIAKEEESHARMVNSLKRQLDAGFHFWNLEAFLPDEVKNQTTQVENDIASAKQPAFTEAMAMDIALRLESSLLDSKFYETAQSNAPEFKQIASVLSRATDVHRKRLQEHQTAIQAKSRTP